MRPPTPPLAELCESPIEARLYAELVDVFSRRFRFALAFGEEAFFRIAGRPNSEGFDPLSDFWIEPATDDRGVVFAPQLVPRRA